MVAASAGLVVFPGLLPGRTAAAATATTNRSDAVTITVQDVSPSTPTESTKRLPLKVTLTLTNTTSSPFNKVEVVAERGAPIGNQLALDDALRRTDPPTGSELRITPIRPVTVNLPAGGGGINTTFTTTTSLLDDGKGICLCHNAVYPLYFRAVGTDSDGSTKTLGTTSTFLPSFDQTPQQTTVAWVWPLIDRPHRLVSDTVFTDDDLSGSVGDGGRLSRALEVVERVGPYVPITVVIDPELLDELEVMSTPTYTVRAAGKIVAGHGQQAATAWLDRFRSVLADNPDVQVALTPFADPDVQSLSADGLSWSSALPAPMSARVATALAGETPIDVEWPVATRIDRSTLDTIAASGTRTVILGSEAVASNSDGGIPASSARLESSSGPVAAALVSPALRSYVRATVSVGGTGAAALPQLTAELAVRAAQQPDLSHLVVLTPPRYVDPSVEVAQRVIRETSSGLSTKPAPLRSAVTPISLQDGTGRLRSVPNDAVRLPAAIIASARAVRDSLPTVTSLLRASSDAATLLAALPRAIQRVESSAWRNDSTVGGTKIGLARSQTLSAEIASLRRGVRIVRPSSGSYTLASGDSPLPITVVNDLNYAVEVDVEVSAVDDLPGFTARRLERQRISAHSKQTIRVPTQVQRRGTIRVQAQLRTASNVPLGDAVQLSVHSTVLGLVGVLITAIAGAVLLIALLVRAGRRLRHRRGRVHQHEPVPQPALATHETAP